MGVLPLQLPAGRHPEALELRPGDRIQVDARPDGSRPRADIPVTILRGHSAREALVAQAAVETRLEVEVLIAGGVIPLILQRALAQADAPAATGMPHEEDGARRA
jgi:aconitate hydratase